MQPASYHPLLPSDLPVDPIAGIPYYRRPDTYTPHLAIPTAPSAMRSPTPAQAAGSMLGAKARAAEYNAAKAASARQQARKDAEEQEIPKPAPVPLGAFGRITSANRNKGVKTFKPLVLSEPAEQENTSKTEADLENKSSSPRPNSVDPPRSATVPPQSNFTTQAEIVRNVQTPYRYREFPTAPIIPFAPRAMLHDDGYGCPSHHDMMPMLSQLQGYHTVYPQHHVSATPPLFRDLEWYNRLEHSYYSESSQDSGLPSTTAQAPLFKPTLKRQNSDKAVVEQKQSGGRPSTPSPLGQQGTTELGGPTFHVFGPDDLSPAKCEVKESDRARLFEEHPELFLAATIMHPVSTPAPDVTIEDRFQPRTLSMHKPSANIEDLIMERNSIGQARSQIYVSRDTHQPRVDSMTGRMAASVNGRTEADWPYLGQAAIHRNRMTETCRLPMRTERQSRTRSSTASSFEEKRPELGLEARAAPPELLQAEAQNFRLPETEAEQVTDIKCPLVDLQSPMWPEIRMPNEEERHRLRRVIASVQTLSISDKYNGGWEDKRGVESEELGKWLATSKKEYEQRTLKTEEVASEMQIKWEHGGSFRSATMSKSEAKRHATTVRAVGSIMSTLAMQTEDDSGLFHRGSRPYRNPPEYAIDKSAASEKDGESNSLFEPAGRGDRAPPQRLAEDSKYRPQLGEAIKFDEGRIPRMFAGRRT
ncbi:hypothetical protein LTR05_007068 [Lithohypha guttulata]|uniref:Uncharacterized protein n=1 Tax=Lithohypha guttulata TaxID=1690604 RepID=A0AAN7Y9I9_9EURO|nr:hypothetical protein LTR05_007068 [Lithohypha guttulata]